MYAMLNQFTITSLKFPSFYSLNQSTFRNLIFHILHTSIMKLLMHCSIIKNYLGDMSLEHV